MPALCATLGLAAGYAGRKAARSGRETGTVAERQEQRSKSGRQRAAKVSPPPAVSVSTDSVEDVLEDRTATQFGRLALWLMDASPQEIERVWRGLVEDRETATKTLDLVMTRWAQLDPRGALAAVEGTGKEHFAWWAWGHAEPERAMAAVLREKPEQAGIVLRAIGQSDPELALRLLEKHPGANAYRSIEGIAEGLRLRDPQRAVEFARAHGQSGKEPMETWAGREPEKCLAWCARNEAGGALSSGTQGALLVLAREHPERIMELADSLPVGGLRSELLRLGVRNLVSHDVEAAVALVEQAGGTGLGKDLQAELGAALAYQDAERSLELLRSGGDQSVGKARAVYPGQSSVAAGSPNYGDWVSQLAQVRPVETLAVVREQYPELEPTVINTWMSSHPAGFSEWLHTEPAGPRRDEHIRNFSRQLTIGPYYPLALEWAVELRDQTERQMAVADVVGSWISATGEKDAESFFESIATPPGAREVYQEFVQGREGK